MKPGGSFPVPVVVGWLPDPLEVPLGEPLPFLLKFGTGFVPQNQKNPR